MTSPDPLSSSRALWNDLDEYRKARDLKSRVVERGPGVPSWACPACTDRHGEVRAHLSPDEAERVGYAGPIAVVVDVPLVPAPPLFRPWRKVLGVAAIVAWVVAAMVALAVVARGGL